MQSERQAPLLEALQRFVSVLEGYTDIVVEMLGDLVLLDDGRQLMQVSDRRPSGSP